MKYYHYKYKDVLCYGVFWGQTEDIFIFKYRGDRYFYYSTKCDYVIDELLYIQNIIDEFLEKLSRGEIS